jgi:hypothetical protein
MRFWKTLRVQPHYLITDLEPRILYRAGHPVISTRSGKGEQMTAGLEHAQDLGPELKSKGDIAAIPLFAHESARGSSECSISSKLRWRRIFLSKPLNNAREMVRRICHSRINALRLKRRQDLHTVAWMQDDAPIKELARAHSAASTTCSR